MIRRIRYALACTLLVVTMPGCLSFLHPLPEPPEVITESHPAIRSDSQASVYVFIVNGHDALGIANLKGVREYLTKFGLCKCIYGDIGHETWMAEELVCANRDYPGSRFVVVGFEYGADSARKIVQAGIDHGASIDLLLYLEPKGLYFNVPVADPAIHRTVVVQNERKLVQCAPVDGAEIISVSTGHRFGVPTQPAVIDLLTNEVLSLAGQIPVIIDGREPIPPLLPDVVPSPRPIDPKKKEQPLDEWDFLKLIGKRGKAPLSPSIVAEPRKPRVVGASPYNLQELPKEPKGLELNVVLH